MKKIISLVIVIIIIFSFFTVPFIVSADDEDKMTTQEYYSSQAYLFTQLKDKKIDYPTYSERSNAITNKYIADNTIIDDVGEHLGNGVKYASDKIGSLGQKIGDTIGNYGDAAYDVLSSLGVGLLDGYAVQNQNPTVDMNGSGAILYLKSTGSSFYNVEVYMYGDYGIIKNDFVSNGYNANGILCSNDTPSVYVVRKYYDTNGSYVTEDHYFFDSHISSSFGSGLDSVNGYGYLAEVKRYGDWRNEDNTSVETDDTYETVSDYDFTQATDKELEDLINDLLNEFELQMPDLSTMEGLLNAIYARLGTLDSDNDNELLSSINAAVLALVKSNNDNSEALLNELLKFREDLKNGTVGTDTVSHGHEISGTLYNVIPLDKNWLNKIFHDKENLKVQYEGKTYYLEDCGCLKFDDKFYTPNMNYYSYAISDYDFSNDDIVIDNSKYVDVDFKNYTALFANFSSGQKKKVNNIIDLVAKFVEQAVPYSAIKGALIPFETIIFNSEKPEDIYFIYRSQSDNASAIDFKAPILSSSFFENPYVSNAMLIVRPFLTIVIGYSWLKVMRKKAVAMLG